MSSFIYPAFFYVLLSIFQLVKLFNVLLLTGARCYEFSSIFDLECAYLLVKNHMRINANNYPCRIEQKEVSFRRSEATEKSLNRFMEDFSLRSK